jgi:hypothetical protein
MMTRDEAIDHIWGLSSQVAGEFCCSDKERDALEAETREALDALILPEVPAGQHNRDNK